VEIKRIRADTTTIYLFFCAFCAFLRLFSFEHPLAQPIGRYTPELYQTANNGYHSSVK
jgi:hypothetical protein